MFGSDQVRAMTQPRIFEGLEGVLVARTQLSSVDGAAGQLVVRGRAIEGLVSEVAFEAMVGLLLDGALPSAPEVAAREAELGAARARGYELLQPRFEAIAADDAMA